MARQVVKLQCELRQKDRIILKTNLQKYLVVFLSPSLISPQVNQLDKEVPYRIGPLLQPQLNHQEDPLTSSISLNIHIDNMTTTANARFQLSK